MSRQSFADKAAIVGVGTTSFSFDSGKTVMQLAEEAVHNALQDAGLGVESINGMLSYQLNDSVNVTSLTQQLNIPSLRWHNDIQGGGTQSASILGDAAMAIDAGLADTIVIFRALNGRSGKRMGQIPTGHSTEQEFMLPYGFLGPLNLCALSAQYYLHQHHYSAEDIAPLIIQQRQHASLNDKALRQKAITLDDYLQSPVIASPLRKLDCCLETDGACALVITSAKQAKTLTQPPVYISACVRGGINDTSNGGTYNFKQNFSDFVAPLLYQESGFTPQDIDIAFLYDAYSYLVLKQLEDFGFCAPREAAAFIRQGDTSLTGKLPLNTHGGLLNEAYVHGLNNIVEAVLQLRHSAGSRQTNNPGIALCTGFGGSYGSAAILSRQ